jgi:hypothetical protein
MFYGHHHNIINPLQNVCVTNDNEHVLFVVITILSSFTTYHRVCNQSNMTGVTSRAETADPSGAHELMVFSRDRVAQSVI